MTNISKGTFVKAVNDILHNHELFADILADLASFEGLDDDAAKTYFSGLKRVFTG